MLTIKDINDYFYEINEGLKHAGKKGEIIIAGGAAMAAIYKAREATKDIDAIFEPAREIREVAETMAKKYDLDGDWLNDGIKGFLSEKLKVETYREYSHLTVKNIDAEGLLALKLTSAREAGADMDDCIFLMKHLKIKKLDELYAIIEKYAYKNQQTPKSCYFTQVVFEKYLEERHWEKKLTNTPKRKGR